MFTHVVVLVLGWASHLKVCVLQASTVLTAYNQVVQRTRGCRGICSSYAVFLWADVSLSMPVACAQNAVLLLSGRTWAEFVLGGATAASGRSVSRPSSILATRDRLSSIESCLCICVATKTAGCL